MVSQWITHLKKVYADGLKKNSTYKYSQAMKDAKKTYNGGTNSTKTIKPKSKGKSKSKIKGKGSIKGKKKSTNKIKKKGKK